MDTFVDERDYSLLERDRYTFFVLRRIIGGSCRTLLSNHENLMICYTDEPYPVWIWTVDGAPIETMEKAYRLAAENGFVNNGQRLNMKYDLAEYMIRRAAEEGKKLSVSTNMFAYDCREPVAPSVKADGNIHRCTAEDLDELTEFLDVFHQVDTEMFRHAVDHFPGNFSLEREVFVRFQIQEGFRQRQIGDGKRRHAGRHTVRIGIVQTDRGQIVPAADLLSF